MRMWPIGRDRTEAIREVLFTVWDPIGVKGASLRDEYDAYIGGIDELLKSGKGDGPLRQYLVWVETEYMAGPYSDAERLEEVVRALREIR